MADSIVVSMGLPKERIEGLRFLLIVIDSNLETHYEFHNKAAKIYYDLLKPHLFKINFSTILAITPPHLIRNSVSSKDNLIGGLSLKISYSKDYSYARISGIGILETFRNKFRALLHLMKAMDDFCEHHGIKFVEAETRVFPIHIMNRAGFKLEPERKLYYRTWQWITKQTHYVKRYI